METLPAILTLLVGAVFGATVQRTNFCTMGALSDVLIFGDGRRLRAWLLAAAVAVIASRALDLAGLVTLERSLYLASAPALPALVLGGLLFGFGMVLSGGCVSKNLVRLGAGSLKALVVLLVFAAVVALTTAALAVLVPAEAAPLATSTSVVAALTTVLAQVVASLALGGGLLVFCLRDPQFRSSPRDLAAGLVLGGLAPVLWLAASGAGAPGLNFVAPIALPVYDGLASPASAGAFLVIGTIAGAFLAARASGTFRIERFAGREDRRRNLAGAALMGVGGALALGCTIGHGLAGLSTLALGSLFALLAMLAGGVAGVRYLEHGSLRGAARALFAGS